MLLGLQHALVVDARHRRALSSLRGHQAGRLRRRGAADLRGRAGAFPRKSARRSATTACGRPRSRSFRTRTHIAPAPIRRCARPGSSISNGRSTVWRRRAARRSAGRSTSRSASSPASRRPGPSARASSSVHKEAAAYAARSAGSSSRSNRSTASNATCSTRSRDAAEVVRAVERAELRLLYDTFHANIEEKDPVGVIAPNLAADQPRPLLRERPRHARQGARALGGDDEGAQARRLRRLVRDRSLRPRACRPSRPRRGSGATSSPTARRSTSSAHDFLREQWAKA